MSTERGVVVLTGSSGLIGAALDDQKIGVIAQNLFDARTGNLIAVPGDRLQEVLAAPRTDGEPFEGVSSIHLNQ